MAERTSTLKSKKSYNNKKNKNEHIILKVASEKR